MDVQIMPVDGEPGGGMQTYAAYGDAFVEGIDSGVEYAVQIRVEENVVYEGETLNLTSDFSSPVYVIGF